MSLTNAVSFTAQSGGTGSFVVGSARPSFLTLAQAVAAGKLSDGATVPYLAQDSLSSPTQREWGQGIFAASTNTIARTTVYGTVNNGVSATGTPLNFSTPPIVSLTVLAENFIGPTEVVPANITYYVSTTGSDVTGDGSVGNPWATALHATNIIGALAPNPAGFPTLQFADGTYQGSDIGVEGANGNLLIQGNVADPSKVVFIGHIGGGGTGVWGFSGQQAIQYCTIQPAAGIDAIFCGGSTTLPFVFNVYFDGTNGPCGAVIDLGIGNFFVTAGTIEIYGTWGSMNNTGNEAILHWNANTIFNNAHAGGGTSATFTSQLFLGRNGAILGGPTTWSGSPTGRKYDVADTSFLTTAGTFPGSTPGVSTFGSVVQDSGGIITPTYTVATLPTAHPGLTAYVTDGTAGLAWGATLTGGGGNSTKYLVWWNGTNWTVIGK